MHPKRGKLFCKVPPMLMGSSCHEKFFRRAFHGLFCGERTAARLEDNFSAKNLDNISTDAHVNHSVILCARP